MKDWRGTEIEVGSHVVYAVTHSSSVTMAEGIVDAIGVIEGEYAWNRGAPLLFVTRLGDHWDAKYGRPVPTKAVKLTALGRVTVVPARP